MRELNEVVAQCKAELDAIGIRYGCVLQFTVNTRAKHRWGQCKKVPGGYIINISRRLLGEDVPLDSLKNTVIHELLHTCKNGYGHKGAWKRLADRVNTAYGYNIKRCSSEEDKGVEAETEPAKEPKYRLVCEGCNTVFERYRASRLTKNPEKFRCGICGGIIRRL